MVPPGKRWWLRERTLIIWDSLMVTWVAPLPCSSCHPRSWAGLSERRPITKTPYCLWAQLSFSARCYYSAFITRSQCAPTISTVTSSYTSCHFEHIAPRRQPEERPIRKRFVTNSCVFEQSYSNLTRNFTKDSMRQSVTPLLSCDFSPSERCSDHRRLWSLRRHQALKN